MCEPFGRRGLQHAVHLRFFELPFPLDDVLELVEDFEPAPNLELIALQPNFITPQHHVDANIIADLAKIPITGTEEHSNLVVVGK